MNILDVVVVVVLLLALWSGWRQGAVLQAFSLGGLLFGVWFGVHYGDRAGYMVGLEAPYAYFVGFVGIVLASMLVAALVARLLRKLLRWVGFGVPDIVLGIVISMSKALLVMCLLVAAIDRFDVTHRLIGEKRIEQSYAYGMLVDLSDCVFPFLMETLEQTTEKIRNDGA